MCICPPCDDEPVGSVKCPPCDYDEPVGSGKRAVDTIEGAVGEPRASKRFNKPELGQSSNGASSSAAAECDTVDADEVEVKLNKDCREPCCTKRRTHGTVSSNDTLESCVMKLITHTEAAG